MAAYDVVDVAFGFNYFDFPPNHVGHERDSGHEEVFFCLIGDPLDGRYEPPSWG